MHGTLKMSGDMTLHKQIIADIEGRILSGEWPPGYRIPYEMELVDTYHCSRMTVNKALGRLADAGLIERRRRAGSYVSHRKAQSAIIEIHDIESEVRSLGLPYRYDCLSRAVRKARSEDRARLGVDEDARIVAVTFTHFAGEQPFCLEDRLISLSAVPEAESECFSRIAAGPWLIGRVPWSAAEHRIVAASADKAIASALAIPLATACLMVERRTWSNDLNITHVRLVYPGDRHTLVARFEPPDSGKATS